MVKTMNQLNRNGEVAYFRPEDKNTGQFVYRADPNMYCGRYSFINYNHISFRQIDASDNDLRRKQTFIFQRKDEAFSSSLC